MKLIKPTYKIITPIYGPGLLKSIERAGRTCYRSETEITSNSAANFVTNIIKNGHHSVLEHRSISILITCDRGVSHELVRHRLASFSQESTIYCNYNGKDIAFIIPPWVNADIIYHTDKIWNDSMQTAETHYQKLINHGWSPQQARSVLPNSLATNIVITANLREWRHILTLRCAKTAHPQMQEIMLLILAEFHERIPVIFNDIYKQFFA